jgi:hypothetical protein
MSSYSDLKVELIDTGAQAGTWGATTNVNFNIALGEAITGSADVDFATAADVTLTLANVNTSQTARNLRLNITESSSGVGYVGNLILGDECDINKLYLINNTTTAAKTIKNTGVDTGITVPAGKSMFVFNNSVNVVDATTYLSSLTLGTDLAVADGGTGSSTASGARTNLGLGTISTQNANAVAITGGTITGITDLAVADGGTGASDPSGARTNLGLGTISTQNANSVSISGGTITGITDLAVADGGTGASTPAGARAGLELGTIATQNSNNVTITGGAISGITDLAVADGGTGASDAAGAQASLNVPSRTGAGASGSWSINAATATNPESGGSFITSSNIGSQSVSFASTAGTFSGVQPIANGGTAATTEAGARSNLNVPTRTGGDASGTWNISVTGNAATASNGGVTSVNGKTGAVQSVLNSTTQYMGFGDTSVTLSGIPIWARRIMLCFEAVTVSGSSDILIQTDDGSFFTYTSASSAISSAVATTDVVTGFNVNRSGTGQVLTGIVTVVLGSTTAHAAGVLTDGVSRTYTVAGSVFSGPVTSFIFTTVSGTETFDDGFITAVYD